MVMIQVIYKNKEGDERIMIYNDINIDQMGFEIKTILKQGAYDILVNNL